MKKFIIAVLINFFIMYLFSSYIKPYDFPSVILGIILGGIDHIIFGID